MDTPTRTVVKAVTWQVIGLVSMTGVGFAFTGSVAQGGGIALFSAGISVLFYILHERAWSRVVWGRAVPPARSAPRWRPRPNK